MFFFGSSWQIGEKVLKCYSASFFFEKRLMFCLGKKNPDRFGFDIVTWVKIIVFFVKVLGE